MHEQEKTPTGGGGEGQEPAVMVNTVSQSIPEPKPSSKVRPIRPDVTRGAEWTAPALPGNPPGDAQVVEIANRVLKHQGLAIPGKHGYQLNYYAIAAAVIAETAARWRHDQPWIFSGKCYQAGVSIIEAIGLKIAAVYGQRDPRRCGCTLAETVGASLRVAPKGAQADRDFWDAQPFLSCLNGTLDLTDAQHPVFHLDRWDPDHHITWVVQAHWNPRAQCPPADRFLTTSIPDAGQRQMFLELSGDAIAKWDQTHQSYGFLVGGGSNGKGIALSVLRGLGGEAVSTISLGDLAAHKFAAAQLVDATINLVGDESSELLRDTSRLKQYTGGDAASVEAKFKAIFSAVPKVKFIFAVNQLPRITDFSIGFFRRPKIVEFPRTFSKDPKLERDLTTPDALSRCQIPVNRNHEIS